MAKKSRKYLLKLGARCLKITEKVSFNIASEASYVYVLSGQKLIKNAKKQSYQTGQKLVENAKIERFKCDILGDFQTLCLFSAS